ncbi:MAG: hypothetical protein D6B26_00830 [Spirochaetaceae bacterium]|nr:MAG: hypothetical protein D6B26_00830 [Spirochaetaceae bacterium]
MKLSIPIICIGLSLFAIPGGYLHCLPEWDAVVSNQEMAPAAAREYKFQLFLDSNNAASAQTEEHGPILLRLSELEELKGNYSRAYEYYEEYRSSAGQLPAEALRQEIGLMRHLQKEDFVRFRLFTLAIRQDLSPSLMSLVLQENLRLSAQYSDWKNLLIFVEMAEQRNALPSGQLSRIRNLAEQGRDFRYRSPKLAKTLSLFLPGAGQLYAGDPLDAANALLINAAVIGASVYAVYSGNIVDTIFGWGPLVLRFYDGNLLNAGLAVEKYNQTSQKAISALILKELDASSSGD